MVVIVLTVLLLNFLRLELAIKILKELFQTQVYLFVYFFLNKRRDHILIVIWVWVVTVVDAA